MRRYKTKDDIMAAIFTSLGIKVLGTEKDKKGKIYFVFDITDVKGKALETLIRREDERIKVVAGRLHKNLEFIRSWLYLTRFKTDGMTSEELEDTIRQSELSYVFDENPPITVDEIADELEEIARQFEEDKDL